MASLLVTGAGLCVAVGYYNGFFNEFWINGRKGQNPSFLCRGTVLVKQERVDNEYIKVKEGDVRTMR